MIHWIKKEHLAEDYVNCISLAVSLIEVEATIALREIHLYHPDSGTWNLRRLFWYIVIGTPVLMSVLAITGAAIKFLLW